MAKKRPRQLRAPRRRMGIFIIPGRPPLQGAARESHHEAVLRDLLAGLLRDEHGRKLILLGSAEAEARLKARDPAAPDRGELVF